ncbi:MAG: TonB-dependent receptor [Acidobacteriota bacterium]
MHYLSSKILSVVAWGVLLGGAVAVAQDLSISGAVTDEKKALVSDVSVVLRDASGKPTPQTTNGAGEFKFESLKSGKYELSLSKKGYESTSRTLTLTNESRVVDFSLGLGRISTTLTVTDSADTNSSTRLYVPDIEVPVQTSVISQQTLRDQNINDLLTALENVSGVTTQKQYGSMEWYTVGGFTQQSGNEFLYVDGMASTGNRANGQLTNIETIEVIKGPAALLLGTSGSSQAGAGGIVNVTRKKPQAQPFQEFFYRAGRWGLNDVGAASTGTVFGMNKLRYRVDMGYSRQDGFRQAGAKRFNISPVLEYLINDRGRVTIQESFSRDRFTEDAGIPVALYLKTGFPTDRKFNPPGDYDRYHDWQNQIRFEYNLGRGIRLQDQFFHEKKYTNFLESETLTYAAANVAAFTLGRSDFFSARHLRPTQNYVTLTGTHRFLGINHNWSASYNYQDHYSWNDRTGATIGSSTTSFPILPVLDLNLWLAPEFTENPVQQTSFPISQKSYVALNYNTFNVQDHIELTKHLSFNVVGSRGFTKRRAHNDAWDPATSTFVSRGVDANIAPQNSTNYRAGLTYLLRSNMSVYVMSSTNFSPVTTIPANIDPAIDIKDLKDPINKNYVAGWKWNTLGGRLKADFNAGKNIALNQFVTVFSTPLNMNVSVQAGQQSSKVADLDLDGYIGWGVHTIGVYGYAACRYDSFSTAATGVNSNFTGRRCTYSNRHSGRSYLTKQIRIGNDKRMSFSLGATYRSRTVMSNAATQDLQYQGGWVRFDAGASFEVTKKWSVAVNIQNLLNRQRFVVSQINGGGTSGQVYPGAPFAATLTLRYQFNHD